MGLIEKLLAESSNSQFEGFSEEEFSLDLTEAHALAGIVKKHYKVGPVPKTLWDISELQNKASPDRTIYTDDGKWQFQFYNGSINITDLTNALQTGKECDEYYISWHGGSPYFGFLLNYEMGDMPFPKLLNLIAKGKSELISLISKKDAASASEISSVTKTSSKGKDVFSPFALGKLKRVSSLPAKPNIQHVIKLIANGQFDLLSLNYSLTDDYAFDASRNNGKLDKVDPIMLVQDMVSFKFNRPHSFTKDGSTVINFGPHSNKSYTMVVNLNNKLRVKV